MGSCGKANESQSKLVKKMHSCQRSGANDLQYVGARQDAGEQEAGHQWEVNAGKEGSNLAGSKGDQAEDQKGSDKLCIQKHTLILSDWADAQGPPTQSSGSFWFIFPLKTLFTIKLNRER